MLTDPTEARQAERGAADSRLVYGSPAWFADPQPFYDHLRETGALELPGQQVRTFLVGRHADVIHVLAHPEVFSSMAPVDARYHDPRIVPTIADNDPPAATAYRKAAYRFFSPGQLRSYRPIFEREAEQLVAGFAPIGEVEWVSEFADALPLRVLTDLLGLPTDMMSALRRWVDEFHKFNAAGDFSRDPGTEPGGELRTRHAELHDYLLEVIEQRRAAPGEGIISSLIHDTSFESRQLRAEELLGIVHLLLVAGVHTTARLLAFSMMILAEDRRQLDAVSNDRKLIPKMIDEALRLESPLSRPSYRWTTVDTTLCGLAVPKGSRVLVMLGAANGDASVFPDARRFDLDRPNRKDHVSFGHGAHFCLGAPLARLEVEIAYNVVLDRLANLRRSRRQGEIEWDQDSPFFRGPRSYLVEFDSLAT